MQRNAARNDRETPDRLSPPPANPRHYEPTGRANARPLTGSAKQSIVQQSKSGFLRRVAPRNDVARHESAFPRHEFARVVPISSARQRAWGMPGAHAPAASREK